MMIYFDNNATTPLSTEVFDAMKPFLTDHFGNPSSAHSVGRETRKIVTDSRRSVAKLLGANDESEIVFTSGGTESDNWAILGALESAPEKRHIVTTRVEHEAVRKLCEKLATRGYEVTWLDVDETGAILLDDVRKSLRNDTAIVSVMLANNETGILFPVNEFAETVKANSKALFHVDAVNAIGKVPIDVKNSAIDLLSVSAHKFQGPKGIGALYLKAGTNLPSAMIGGGQESGRRAGTEAVHQIAGIGKAADLAADLSPMIEIGVLRDKLENEILQITPNSRLNGTADRDKRLPNTSSISFENTNGEAILAMLDDLGVCVSTGSACNAENHVSSAVLEAMNVPYSFAMGSIRFSLGRQNTSEEVDFVLGKLPGIIGALRSISG